MNAIEINKRYKAGEDLSEEEWIFLIAAWESAVHADHEVKRDRLSTLEAELEDAIEVFGNVLETETLSEDATIAICSKMDELRTVLDNSSK